MERIAYVRARNAFLLKNGTGSDDQNRRGGDVYAAAVATYFDGVTIIEHVDAVRATAPMQVQMPGASAPEAAASQVTTAVKAPQSARRHAWLDSPPPALGARKQQGGGEGGRVQHNGW